MEWMLALEGWVLALTGSPAVFLALFLFCVIDGFFPPIPSESVVIALGALAMTTGDPNLWLVVVVGALGAFVGDQIAYSIGSRIPLRTMRWLRGPRGQAALDRAEQALRTRGAAYILAARYIPIGRVAVNMSAGAMGYPRTRFTGVAALAAIMWAGYSVLLGMSAGVWLKEHPWLAVVAGVVLGVVLGLAVDAIMRSVARRHRGRGAGAADLVAVTPPGETATTGPTGPARPTGPTGQTRPAGSAEQTGEVAVSG